MPGDYVQPWEAAFTTTPMYAGDPGPRYTGPLNVDTGNDMLNMLLQVGGTPILQSMMAQHKMTPLQFIPMQGAYDQMVANQYYNQQQRAMQVAAARDRGTIEDVIGGATKMFTGAPLTSAQRQQAFGMAQQVSNFTPLLIQALGPDLVDALHGSRGSAAVMAQALHRGLRTARDPVSGGIGVSGDSAGVMAQEVFEQLFGRNANPAALRGMSAGQAGLLFEEMHARGLADTPLGGMSLEDRLGAVGRMELTDAQVSRLSENTSLIRGIRDQGRDPTRVEFDRAEQQIRDTHKRIREGTAPGAGRVDATALTEMPGTEDMLRASDADRISGRVKQLSGVVSAMRDIFGDNGRPNAPMRELINGLEALTQGGLTNMSPGELERMVRMTATLGKTTGVGLQTMIGLTAHAGEQANRLGLDRSLAVQATQGAVAFGAAAADTQRLNMPAFGSLNKEELTLFDQQLRMNAAASPVTNQFSTTVRAFQEGLVKADTEAGRLAQALQAGQLTYDTTGRGDMRSVHMHPNEWRQLMGRSGLDENTTYNLYSDKFMNQEYTRRFQLQNVTRQLQARVDLAPKIAANYNDALSSQLRSRNVNQVLRDRLGMDDNQIRDMERQISTDLAQQTLELTPEQYRDQPTRVKTMGTMVQKALDDRIRAQSRAAGRSAAEQEQDVQAARTALGDEGATQIGVSTYAAWGAAIRNDPRRSPLKGPIGELQVFGRRTQEAMQARLIEADTESQMASSLSGLGRSGPIQRIVDTIREAEPGEEFTKILAKIGGGVEVEKFRDHPQLQALSESYQRFNAAERDASGQLTTAGQQQRLREARVSEALVTGGHSATIMLREMQHARKLEREDQLEGAIDKDLVNLEHDNTLTADQKRTRRSQLEQERRTATGLRRAVTTNMPAVYRELGQRVVQVGEKDVARLVARGELAGKLAGDLGEAPTTEAQELASTTAAGFMTLGRQTVEALRGSTEDMEQIGHGATDLLRGLEDKDRQLQELAKSSEFSVEDLLSGKGPKEAQKKAQKLRQAMIADWTEIGQRQRAANGPAASRPKPMTDLEKRAVAADASFYQERFREQATVAGGSPEEQAKLVKQLATETAVDRMIAAAPKSEQDKLKDGRESLIKLASRGDRAWQIHQALGSRDQLLQLAAEQGLVTHDGKKLDAKDLSKATAAEKDAAIKAIDTSKLAKDDQEVVRRWQTNAAVVGGFNESNLESHTSRIMRLSAASSESPTRAALPAARPSTTARRERAPGDDVVEDLIAAAPADKQAALRRDRQTMLDELAVGDRAVHARRAFSSRRQLVELAAKHGFVSAAGKEGDGAAQDKAIEKLNTIRNLLPEEERRNLEQWQRESAPLRGLGSGASLQDRLDRIAKFQAGERTTADAGRDRKSTVTGRLQLTGLKEVLMEAQMTEMAVEFNPIVQMS